MGNVIYGDQIQCYENLETCKKSCARFECVYVDKCTGGGDSLHYVCLPFDTRFFMWLLVGIFLVVVLGCSTLVVCYAIRAIRASFRHALVTENDIVFYNARNVNNFPHPANGYNGYNNTPQQPPIYQQPGVGYGLVKYPLEQQQRDREKR